MEVSELPASFRSAGGAHTSPKVMAQQRARSARPSVEAIIEVRVSYRCMVSSRAHGAQFSEDRPSVEIVGDDGRVYMGRNDKASPTLPKIK